MSFIPGETGGAITNIATGTGSGIVSTTTFNGTNLTSGLIAGANVTLTPTAAFGGKGLRIDTTPGIAGVTSVTAGTGITLTGTATDPVVNNAGVLTVATTGSGSGITISGTAQNPQIANAGVLTVATTGSGSGITISGTAQNPQIANAGVLGVNSQQGQVTIASAGGTIAITNPTPGTINLEQSGGGGTLTGITAGAGIQVSGSAPSPTVTNIGVTSLTAGNNMLVSAPSGAVVLAAKVARPMSFSLAGARTGFPINTSAYGSFGINTLTTLGDLLAGINEFVGVNTGYLLLDMSSYGLTTVTGQNGGYNVYLRPTSQPAPGLLVQSLQPTYPDGATQDTAFNLGMLILSIADFRTAYGTGALNAFITISIQNNNVNQVFPGGNAVNFIAWYWPDSII